MPRQHWAIWIDINGQSRSLIELADSESEAKAIADEVGEGNWAGDWEGLKRRLRMGLVWLQPLGDYQQ